jgi:hypothetical protein
MRVGVIARTNSRGLDVQTTEAARNLNASVLIVDVRNHSNQQFPTDITRFPGAPVVECMPGWKLDPAIVKPWLDTVDVVYTAETFYDPNFTRWARAKHVVTVVHANPEFVAPGGGWAIGDPSARWSPTCWRNEFMPQPTDVVPFPVAMDRFAPVEPHDGQCRWLHVGGKQAMADRNGTESLLEALRHLKEPCTVTVCTQESAVGRFTVPSHVTVNVVKSVPNYWDLYPGHDALVMPRRYGGLCLPTQEAMAAGMAVLMPDISPNPQSWPVATFPARLDQEARMPAGQVPVASIDPVVLAAAMDRFADPKERYGYQARSQVWAVSHSWNMLRPDWLQRMSSLR